MRIVESQALQRKIWLSKAIFLPCGVLSGTRLFVASMGTSRSSYGPTPTHRRSLEIAETEFAGIRQQLNGLVEQRIPALEDKLLTAGAPWIPGNPVPEAE